MEKQYICDCGKVFLGKYLQFSAHTASCKIYLTNHNKTCTFVCELCGATYTTLSTLTQHVKYKHLNVKRGSNKKVTCYICSNLISVNNIDKHIKRHENNPKSFEVKETYKLDHDDLFCKFCGKECKNTNSLTLHEIKCKYNPNRVKSYFSEYNNSQLHAAWNKGLTKETDERVAKNGLSILKFFREHPEKKTGGYKLKSVKYLYKYGTYKGFYCDSSWELAFVIYCLENNINIVRNECGFNYINSDGEQKLFYPDFIIDNVYYEIKGGYDKLTKYKVSQFPHNLILLDNKKIKPYLKYCVDKYGKDFIRLYDRNYPSWMDKETIE